MNPEHWISIVSVVATVGLALFTVVINRRDARRHSEEENHRHREELDREYRRHRDEIEREEKLRRERRLDQPHIEFTVNCEFFGPVKDQCLAEINLCAHNKGQVIQRFSRIFLRIRGVPRQTSLERWKGRGDRAYFPVKVAEQENIIPEGVSYFAEPGIRQVFAYITTIPTDQRFILVSAEFDYLGEKDKTHDCERVFDVPARRKE